MLHRNLLLKVAALALAVFLWFWVLFTQRTLIVETTARAPVSARDLAGNLALERELPLAEVRLRGMKEDLADGVPRVEPFVSCGGMKAGGYLLPVEVVAPENLTLVQVRPARVQVTLEPVVRESKLVEPNLTGALPPEYELIAAEVAPKYAEVMGAQSRVSRIARLLASLDLSRVTPELPGVASIQAVDQRGNRLEGITISPARAEIALTVKQAVVTRTVPVVLRSRGGPPRGYRIVSARVEPAMVTLSGPANKVVRVRAVDTEELSLEGVTARIAHRLPLVVPDGTKVLDGGSVIATVEVERERPGAPSGHD
jgi:YbbR domain-containing protein